MPILIIRAQMLVDDFLCHCVGVHPVSAVLDLLLEFAKLLGARISGRQLLMLAVRRGKGRVVRWISHVPYCRMRAQEMQFLLAREHG